MSMELFSALLLTSTIINIPLTQFIKKLMLANKLPYRGNIIPFWVSLTVCTGVGVVYRLPFGLGFDTVQVYRLFLLIIATWLLSMHVYDRYRQLEKQNKRYRKEMEEKRNV